MKRKKGQYLTLTTLFAVFIFFLAVTIFLQELLDGQGQGAAIYDHLQQEAGRAMRALASQGYPQDWDVSTVQRAGITTDGYYDKEKRQRLQGIDYGALKEYLGITDNYLLLITDDEGTTTIGEYPNEQALKDRGPSYLATRTTTLKAPQGTTTITIHTYRVVP